MGKPNGFRCRIEALSSLCAVPQRHFIACTSVHMRHPRFPPRPDPGPTATTQRSQGHTMPEYRTQPNPAFRSFRTCGLLKHSDDDFYEPGGVTPRLDCRKCEDIARTARRRAAMETEESRARRREQWRRDQARYRARKRMDPTVWDALDAAALKAKDDAKNRKAAFARFRLADAQREDAEGVNRARGLRAAGDACAVGAAQQATQGPREDTGTAQSSRATQDGRRATYRTLGAP